MSDSRVHKNLFRLLLLLVCVLGLNVRSPAQSLDARSPTSVRSNEIVGRIGARDLGDSRLTDHFYAFTGTPGDLVITIETQNLNGDMDVFTAGGLRPVLKVALYAEIGSPVSKSVYLRQREDLILRIEARTPNDVDGIYHIRFSGSFEPIAGAEENNDTNAASESSNTPARRGSRVSSVGARINEPPPPVEVAAAPTPEPTPAATPEVVEPKTESAAGPTPKSVRSRPTSRRARDRTPTAAAKPVIEAPVESTPAEETAKPETVTAAPEESAPAKSKAPRKGRSAPRKTEEVANSTDTESPSSKSSNPKGVSNPRGDVDETQPAAQGESKLIIELMDGTRIERPMTDIRRVTLESGQVVVVGTDGNVERIRLARVLRMSIGQ